MATMTRLTLTVCLYATTLFFFTRIKCELSHFETKRMEQSSNCNIIHMLNDATTFQNQAINLDDFVNAIGMVEHHEHFLNVLWDYRVLLPTTTGIGGGANNPSHTTER
jgi:hypothetical protein